MLENYLRYINIPVNKILLDDYAAFGMDERSLIVIIRLMDRHSVSAALPDFTTLSNGTTMSENDISKIIQNMIEKGILEVRTVTEGGKYVEHFNLEPLYRKLSQSFDGTQDKTVEPSRIRALFEYVEQLYGRVISPNEFQRMNSWLDDSGHTPEAIREAIDLAYKNQVTSLQYVERILNSTEDKREQPEPKKHMPVRSWLEGEDVFD